MFLLPSILENSLFILGKFQVNWKNAINKKY